MHGLPSPVHTGWPFLPWCPRVHGLPSPVHTGWPISALMPPCARAFWPRAHRVGRSCADYPVHTGHFSPCARGPTARSAPSPPWTIYSPSSSSNPNLFSSLLEPPLLEHHFAHSSHLLHPNLLIFWDLREQGPIYTSTKPICVPRKISSPLTCYSWSFGS